MVFIPSPRPFMILTPPLRRAAGGLGCFAMIQDVSASLDPILGVYVCVFTIE